MVSVGITGIRKFKMDTEIKMATPRSNHIQSSQELWRAKQNKLVNSTMNKQEIRLFTRILTQDCQLNKHSSSMEIVQELECRGCGEQAKT